MVGNDILCHIKPESGHLRQYCPLSGHFVVKDHVETADPVGGNHDQAVAIIVNLTYLACFHGLKFLNTHSSHSFVFFFRSDSV